MIKKLSLILLILMMLPACKLTSLTPVPTATAVSANPTPLPPTATPVEEAATAEPVPITTPAPDAAPVTIANTTSRPPQRDDVALAIAYLGVSAEPQPTAVFVVNPLTVGTTQQLNINNVDTNIVSTIEAELLGVSKHAYFWFDKGPGSEKPNASTLASILTHWDKIYETDVYYFGSESNPGIDGDPRVHIVHASPLALCDVTESTAGQCGLAGYFTASNVVSTAVDPNSNEREMFIMNVDQFGTDFYLNVLAHEFRHMIEDNHDQGDADWAAEGSATLAEELNGYPDSGQYRGNLFLSNPDQQLNSWTDGNTTSYYGQGYVLMRYLFDRLGEDLYREFAISEAYGLQGVDELSAKYDLGMESGQFFLDWLVALAVHNEKYAPEMYQFKGTSLDTVFMTNVSLPQSLDTTVAQYAADYYELPTNKDVTIDFQGKTAVSLLNTTPPAGDWMWVAQRANYSMPRLTRTVDLRDAATATLDYDVYVDIEEGYDFAYVSVSTDGGQTWQGLTGDNMQGTEAAHDPAGVALTDRYYTGREQAWFHESIDLTAYAGQEIQLRYEYVTDLILTYGGLALDNITIPEIGFADDAESVDSGWVAEGFARSGAMVPQAWPLQLVTISDEGITVQLLAVDENGRFTQTIPKTSGVDKRILIIAATAPQTLTDAHYVLSFE